MADTNATAPRAKKTPAPAPTTEAGGNRATRRAAKKAPAKTSTATKKAAAVRTTTELPFHGRKVTVIRPSSEQLAVWQIYLDRLQGTGGQTKPDPRTMVKLLGRLVTLTQSLLVNEADKTWIEDQLLDGHMKLPDAVQLVQLTTQKFGADTAPAVTGKAPATSRARRG
jgi:hypothetical protein